MKRGMTRREREVTDRNEILNILDTCKIVHVGLVDEDEPYIVPMNYGYTMEDGLTIYLHSATKGYKLDLIRKNPKVFIEMDCDIVPIEGNMPCQYGTTYKSLMGRGLAEIVENVEEKIEAMKILMKTQTGKEFEFNEKLVSVVSVIKISISEYTAKADTTFLPYPDTAAAHRQTHWHNSAACRPCAPPDRRP